jgi:hypothetical protein
MMAPVEARPTSSVTCATAAMEATSPRWHSVCKLNTPNQVSKAGLPLLPQLTANNTNSFQFIGYANQRAVEVSDCLQEMAGSTRQYANFS